MGTAEQLASVREELEHARRDVHDLARRAGSSRWSRPPAAGGWPVGHCVEHLNVTSEAFLPRLTEAVGEAKRVGAQPGPEYRLGPIGWVFCRILEPPYRVRAKTPSAFDPSHVGTPEQTLARFDALQARLDELIVAGEGLALDRFRVVSPFSSRMRYSVYAAFRIIAAHQRRHLWQAERVLDVLAVE